MVSTCVMCCVVVTRTRQDDSGTETASSSANSLHGKISVAMKGLEYYTFLPLLYAGSI